eukprot:5571920-Amphidinium_carterae.1
MAEPVQARFTLTPSDAKEAAEACSVDPKANGAMKMTPCTSLPPEQHVGLLHLLNGRCNCNMVCWLTVQVSPGCVAMCAGKAGVLPWTFRLLMAPLTDLTSHETWSRTTCKACYQIVIKLLCYHGLKHSHPTCSCSFPNILRLAARDDLWYSGPQHQEGLTARKCD